MIRSHARWLLLMLGTTPVFSPAETPTTTGLGDFGGRSLTIQSLLKPSAPMNAASLSGTNLTRIAVHAAYGNIMTDDNERYMVDGEWGFVDLTVAASISPQLELGIMIPYSIRTGGFMDGIIEGVHDTIGTSQQGRDVRPRDRVVIARGPDGSPAYLLTDDASGLNDIPLFLNWVARPADDAGPMVTLQARVTLPTGDDTTFTGIGEPTYAIGVLVAQRIGNSAHHLYAQADISHTEAETVGGFALRQEQAGASLAWEYRYTPRTSFLARYEAVTGLFEDLGEWSQEAHHLRLGVKHQLAGGAVFETGIQQNLFRYENSTDFALTIGIAAAY